MKILDRYIFVRYLGTFVFSLSMFLVIAVVFDITEKIEDFLSKDVALNKIVFDYYLNFIPFFGNIFSPLFVFISVIFFTSRLAEKSEIISILASGVSFRRILVPYLLGATVIALTSYFLSSWVLPPANKTRIDFTDRYVYTSHRINTNRNMHFQSAENPNLYYYLESYGVSDTTGYRFSAEYLVDGRLTSKIWGARIKWLPQTKKWRVYDYYIRDMDGLKERIQNGVEVDTAMGFTPADFDRPILDDLSLMNNTELQQFIDSEIRKGKGNIPFYLVEKHKRIAVPFSTYILTLMGVALSARKVRGGIGLNLGIGVSLSFTYILLMQFSTIFSSKGNFPPMLAAWIPNILFACIAVVLLYRAPK